jgi:hypothetical protein
MVLHLLNFGSIEKSKLHVLWFQSSAAGSQACAAQSVQLHTPRFKNPSANRDFRGFLKEFGIGRYAERSITVCEKRAQSLLVLVYRRAGL